MLRRRLYYALKPYLPWRIRAGMRRVVARRKREASQAVWPIHHAAARPPMGWPGWPDGKKFAFVLTHDVEGPVGLAKCRRLAEVESSLGFRSAFNLIPEGPYPVPEDLRGWLGDRGFEIGVHDLHHDGELYQSRKAFRKSAQSINHHLKDWGATGFRSGFMFHALDWLHDLDIEYDCSSFDTDPFEPQPDAAGTIFPFWVPPAKDQPGRGYVELPYTLPQDSTLFLILREKSPEIWLNKLDWVAQQGGMALVNVHPDYIRFPGEAPSTRTFPLEHYIRLLKHVRDNHAGTYWQPLPQQVARHVAARRPQHAVRPARRVCLITYSFYERDTRVLRYGEALAQRGDEVEVLSLRSSPKLPREEIVKGCRVVRLQPRTINEKSPAAFLFRLIRFLWQTSRWVSRNHSRRPFDLVHVHNIPDFLVFAGWRPKLGGAKIILDIHDIVPELFASKFGVGPGSPTIRLLRLMEHCSAAFADHVILANHLWVDLYTRRSAPPEKVTVLINYVDRHIFYPRPRTRTDDRKIAIFPGSLQWHQGLDVAVRAFPKVVEEIPQAELHIYGEGQVKSDLIALSAKLGLNGHVKFFGFVPSTEIASVMAEADLGVVPKRADSFGNEAFSTKILEFMSLGVPVVASSTRIDRFYFDDTVVRFFASGNPDALAERIVESLRYPDKSRQMARRAAEVANQNSWEKRQADYLGLVDRLIASQPEAR
ncbi:MAG: glycosyltransferase [Opitutaceae bacterium]